MKGNWMTETVVLAAGLLLACASAVSPARATDAGEGGGPALKNQLQKASYGIGVEMGRNLRRQKIAVDPELVTRGLNDALAGNKLLLSEEELLATMNAFAGELRAKQGEARLIAAQENKKQSEEFLAANKLKAGVVTLPSGLQYKILKAGNGPMPGASSIVQCHYRGTLIDGTEFENTGLDGQPATLKISDPRVIPGLREALKLMPVGSKWQIFVPYQLAYVGRGSGRFIGPNATLIYELELLTVK